jgi:3-deoxy-D-manno-octulosonic-acid transferase
MSLTMVLFYDRTKIGVNLSITSTDQNNIFLYAIEPLRLCAVFITFGNSNYIFMKILYNLGIVIFSALARFASLFNSRASLWVEGRKMWAEKIASAIKSGDRVIWIHCASLGEFEQGRAVIETIKKDMPEFKIVLTFFSPSGYEIRKNYKYADCISYLPSDTPANAVKFIDLIRPELVIFVKYEFWNNYISELYRKRIPLYLISGIFRPGQHFFKWYGGFFREMLRKFEKIFVQDKRSLDLLNSIGIEKVSVAGDTRFDRVVQIAATARDIPQLDLFRGSEKVFLAGSSWKPDEEIIAAYIDRYPLKMKWIFAPHKIDKSNIERLEKLLSVKCVRFSEFKEGSADARVLIMDNIGMLSSAYRYAYIAEIGGGFGKGIHNILEPACWGIPVLFGPKHENFKEAVDLLISGGAKSFRTYDEFKGLLELWLSNEKIYTNSAQTASEYVKENAGATEIIIKEIAQKDINTRR